MRTRDTAARLNTRLLPDLDDQLRARPMSPIPREVGLPEVLVRRSQNVLVLNPHAFTLSPLAPTVTTQSFTPPRWMPVNLFPDGQSRPSDLKAYRYARGNLKSGGSGRKGLPVRGIRPTGPSAPEGEVVTGIESPRLVSHCDIPRERESSHHWHRKCSACQSARREPTTAGKRGSNLWERLAVSRANIANPTQPPGTTT